MTSQIPKSKSSKTVIIKSKFWNKDSKELFDFESSNYCQFISRVSSDTSVTWNGNFINWIPVENTTKKDKVIASLQCNANKICYSVSKTSLSNTDIIEEASFIYWNKEENVKPKNKGKEPRKLMNDDQEQTQPKVNTNYLLYELKQGDIIKIGKLNMKIRSWCIDKKEIVHTRNNNTVIPKSSNEILHSQTKHSKFTSMGGWTKHEYGHHPEEEEKKILLTTPFKKRVCRICYNTDEDWSSLLSPCHCIGGLKYIHLSCWQNWIYTKCVVPDSIVVKDVSILYMLKQISCEICLEKFPDFVVKDNEQYEIYNREKITSNISNNFSNYVILESIPRDSKDTKLIVIGGFDMVTSLSIGRSHECDIIINDLSVSRKHAELYKMKNKYFIKDNNSRFGTWAYIQSDSIEINEHDDLIVQVGNNVLQMTMQVSCPCLMSFIKCWEKKKYLLHKYGKRNSDAVSIKNTFKIVEEANEIEDEHNVNSNVNINNLFDDKAEFWRAGGKNNVMILKNNQTSKLNIKLEMSPFMKTKGTIDFTTPICNYNCNSTTINKNKSNGSQFIRRKQRHNSLMLSQTSKQTKSIFNMDGYTEFNPGSSLRALNWSSENNNNYRNNAENRTVMLYSNMLCKYNAENLMSHVNGEEFYFYGDSQRDYNTSGNTGRRVENNDNAREVAQDNMVQAINLVRV